MKTITNSKRKIMKKTVVVYIVSSKFFPRTTITSPTGVKIWIDRKSAPEFTNDLIGTKEITLDQMKKLSELMVARKMEESSNIMKTLKELNCEHSWSCSSGGDAESGPITYSQCSKCGKTETQFGM